MMYQVVIMLSALLESIMALMLCEALCIRKSIIPAYLHAVGAVVAAVFIGVSNFFLTNVIINAVMMMLTFFLLTFLYVMKMKTRIMVSVLNYLIIIITEVIVLYGLTLIYHVTVTEVINLQIYRIQGTIVSKLLYLLPINILRMKFKRSKIYRGTSYWLMFLIMLITSIVTVFLIFGLTKNAENTYLYNLSIICSFGLLFTTFCEMYLYEHLIKQMETIKNKEYDEQQLKMQLKHLDEILTAQESLKKFKHDFKRHMIGLEGYIKKRDFEGASKYIENLSGESCPNEYVIETGNTAFDAILSSKFSIAQNAGIKITYTINVPEKIAIAPVDICTIFGNILDNAIEACERTDVAEKKIVVIALWRDDSLFCKIANTAPRAEADLSRTSKTDKKNHGFGLENIKTALATYDSIPIIERRDTEFLIKFTIFAKG